MVATNQVFFSGPVRAFLERRLPEVATPVGYAALIDALVLKVPIPAMLSAIGPRHKVYAQEDWHLYTPRHAPEPSLEGHLVFALKYEGLDLTILKALFKTVGPEPILAIVRATPTGAYARRLWFLFEWLTGTILGVPDAVQGSYVQVVDPEQQWCAHGILSSRHRVKDNLPGTPAFCPMIRMTERLKAYRQSALALRAHAAVAAVPKDVLARTATFLLLNDSRSSFAIEGEAPPQDRIQRWGRVIGEAGRRVIDLDELLRLQKIVIGDARFVKLGLRHEGSFVGEHDRTTGAPLPDHISARHEDLPDLVAGLVAFDRDPDRGLDTVLVAAALAFGFVYIHPFEDGNGRIHRYLIHHVLAERYFNPPGMVFPVSSAILARIDEYRQVLESVSRRILPAIHWEPTERGNVRVLNDTADFYRYFDATPHAEFLYSCIEQTIEFDLPHEARVLVAHDRFRRRLGEIIDMPDRTADLLFRFLGQNDGKLSQRAREREFASLSEVEAGAIEQIYDKEFS